MSQFASNKVEDNENEERLVSIRRVSKVVKGGRRFGFSALVITGDQKGKVGYGSGKSLEVMSAKQKAADDAKKKLVRVPLKEGRTIHHDTIGIYGSAKVILRSAPAGTGIIAGGPLRAVFECLGIHDIVTKSVGTSNPHNMVKACFAAFESMSSPRLVAERRGKKVGEIVGRRESSGDDEKQAVKKADVPVAKKKPASKPVSAAKKAKADDKAKPKAKKSETKKTADSKKPAAKAKKVESKDKK